MSEQSLRRNFLWNTAGVIFFLVCQWLTTVLVVRFSDDYTASGILSLAMSMANIFAMIALFNVRNYQVSDVEGRFSQSEYLALRIITVGAALVLCTATAAVLRYEPYVFASIVGYMILKLTENFADVLHGTAQKKERLDVAGKSFLIRGALMLVSFVTVFPVTGNLALAIAVMALTNLLAVLFYDLPVTKRIEPLSVRDKYVWRRALPLMRICLPMLVYGLAVNSMMPVAKCIMEAARGEQTLGIYSSITTVTMLIQTFVTLIFTPLIGGFGAAYAKGERSWLARTLSKLVIIVAVITALAMLAVRFFGDFFMGLVFGEKILPYVYLLYPTVIISALSALTWLLGMVLVVMRSMKCLLVGAVLGFAIATVLSAVLCTRTTFSGVNLALAVGFAVIVVIYSARFVYYLIKSK